LYKNITFVGIAVDGGRLVIEPQKRPRYTLEELLDQCDSSAPIAEDERDWLDAPPPGTSCCESWRDFYGFARSDPGA
jgi:hypothetical protein